MHTRRKAFSQFRFVAKSVAAILLLVLLTVSYGTKWIDPYRDQLFWMFVAAFLIGILWVVDEVPIFSSSYRRTNPSQMNLPLQTSEGEVSADTIHKKQALLLLSKYRHETMNQIQLVKAYLQLGKLDRAASSVEAIVWEAKKYNQLASIWNPIVSYAAVSAALEHPSVDLEISTRSSQIEQSNDELFSFSSQELDNAQLSMHASLHVADIIQGLYEIGQELQEDLDADLKWTLLVRPDGEGMNLNLRLIGNQVTDAYIEEMKRFIGDQALILKSIQRSEEEHDTQRESVILTARLVSLTGEPIWS